MDGIKGTKPAGLQYNWLFDAVVEMMKSNKRIIDHAIYIKEFSVVTVSYLRVSTADVLNTTNNEIQSPELTWVL